jgi:hypothetical protein
MGVSHRTTISYVDYNGGSTLAYPTAITDPSGFTSSVEYNYDTGAITKTLTPSKGTGVTGDPVQYLDKRMSYDSVGRLERITTQNNGAYTRYARGVFQIPQTTIGVEYVNSYSTIKDLQTEAYQAELFTGAGQRYAVATDNPGSTGGYKGQQTFFDKMARVLKQSNPTEINSSWTPSGPDDSAWIYKQYQYDWKGRPLVITDQLGKTMEAIYVGCGCAGGEVVVTRDEIGRRQKLFSDPLGRAWKTQVLYELPKDQLLNGDGPIYSATVNEYNALDQVKSMRQFSGDGPSNPSDLSCPGGTCQKTAMTYDGYARILTKHSPEQQPEPGNSASSDHTTFHYNDDDTLAYVIDARGVVKNFSYNTRGMVLGTTYYLGNIPAPYNHVSPVSDVTFEYDAARNRTRMTDGTGSITYQYDDLSRLSWEKRRFATSPMPNVDYQLSYQYNIGGELKKITDNTNTTINYNYDSVGQITGVTGEDNLVQGDRYLCFWLQISCLGGAKGCNFR